MFEVIFHSCVIILFYFLFLQSGEACQLRVCNQRGVPRLVYSVLKQNILKDIPKMKLHAILSLCLCISVSLYLCVKTPDFLVSLFEVGILNRQSQKPESL